MKRFAQLLAIFGVGIFVLFLVNLIAPKLLVSIFQFASRQTSMSDQTRYALQSASSGLLLSSFGIFGLAALFYYLDRLLQNLPDRYDRFLLTSVLAIRIIIGVLLIYAVHYVPGSDDLDFHRYATQLANGEEVTDVQGRPTAWRAIGYPFLLSLFYRLFGADILTAQIVNLIISETTLILIYALGRALFDRSTARASMILFLLWPSQLLYAVSLFSELAFTMFFLMLLWISTKSPTFLNAIFIGIALGLATLTRGVILLFPMLLIVYWMIQHMRWKSIATRLIIIGITTEALLLPWQIRNYRIFNQFVLTNTMGGVHFWMGNNPNATGTFMGYLEFMSYNERMEIQSLNECELDKYGYRKGFDYIVANPGKTILNATKKIIHFFIKDSRSVPFSLGADFQTVSPVFFMVLIIITETYYLVLLFLFLYHGFLLVKYSFPRAEIALLLYSVLYFIAIYSFYIAEGRYHTPVVPIFALIAAYKSKQSPMTN